MYEIILSITAEKQFKKLEKKIQIRITNSLERIRIRPENYVTKIIGEKAYKLRVGQYRVIMDIKKAKLRILVIKVGHRRNIYKD